MKRRRSDGERPLVRPKEIDPQLPTALEVAAEMGDTDPEELASILVRALQLPGLGARLKTLLAEDGMSPELQEEHLRVLERWRRNVTRSSAKEPAPRGPTRKPS
jgi:hypothetical protein